MDKKGGKQANPPVYRLLSIIYLMVTTAHSSTAAAAAMGMPGLGWGAAALALAGGRKQRQHSRGVHAFTLFTLNGCIGLTHWTERLKFGLTIGAVIFV